jgi:hypothetical protein
MMYAAFYTDFYLRNGINILPIGIGSKNPTYSWKEYQTTKLDNRDQLREHEGNFFVICGKISDNLKILDIENWDIYEKYFSDIESFTVKTPHGGVHIYYKYADNLSRIDSVNGWPVEVRGEGHGCTSAGSSFEGKEYKVIKDLPIITQDLSKLAHERLVKLSDDRDADIQSWKKKIDISKVISQTVKEVSRNKGCWMGICPFHNDTNPSLAVYKDSYYCFGCREHGDVIKWVEKRDGIGFKEAVEKLSKEFEKGLPRFDIHSGRMPSERTSDIEIGESRFQVQCLDGSFFVNRSDITEFIYSGSNIKITEALRTRIAKLKKDLGLDDLGWNQLINEVKSIAPNQRKALRVAIKSKKSGEDSPYVSAAKNKSGTTSIFPRIGVIAAHLIEKFNLVAICEENQEEGLTLWIGSGNDYRQLSKNNEFLIKEMQTTMSEYEIDGKDLSEYVDLDWINRIEILRQAKVKHIVQPIKGMFPVANGILDIKNRKLLTDDEGKICLVRSGVNYDANATCPEFDKFLADIFNNNQKKIEAFLSMIGAIVAGMEPQIIILMMSRGRSGKGILMGVVSALLGGMITMMSPNKLHERFSNWGFLHRRATYMEEFDGKMATVNAMKELSGGVSSVSFETKGVQAIMQAQVQCAIFMITNNPPPFEKGSAWEERLKVFDFPNSYLENPVEPWEKKIDYGIKDRLMKELPGILNKVLLYSEYALDHPEKIFKQDIPYADIKESLDRATDSLDSFINDCCELAPVKQDSYHNMKTMYNGYETTDTTFMKKYEDFCSGPGVNTRASDKKYVKKALKEQYQVIVKNHKLIGIKLKEKAPELFKGATPNLSSYIVEAEE